MKIKLIKYLTLIMLLAFVLSITCVSAFATDDSDDSIVGTWVLNLELNFDNFVKPTGIVFVADNYTYDGISYTTTHGSVGMLSYFDSTTTDGTRPLFSLLVYTSNSEKIDGYGAGYSDVNLRTIEILEYTGGAEFIAWLQQNATFIETTMLLAGEYTLNDTLVLIDGIIGIPCDLAFTWADVPYGSSDFYGLIVIPPDTDEYGQTSTCLAFEGSPLHYIYDFDTNSYNAYAGLDFTLNIQEDTYVPNVWYDFFVENTNYLDVINGNDDENKSIYQTIYDLLKVGVYGNDYALTSGQTFALEQLSLWLSLFVILAPIFVTLAILVRCVRL